MDDRGETTDEELATLEGVEIIEQKNGIGWIKL
jgi:hypothetical protein